MKKCAAGSHLLRKRSAHLCKALCLALLVALAAACGGPDGSSEAPPPEVSSFVESAAESQSAPEEPENPPMVDLPEAGGPMLMEVPAPSLAANLIGEGDTRQVAVCLPPGYSGSDAAYPVMTFLTGYTEAYDYRAEFFYSTLGALYADGALDGMIVVVVNGANRFGGGWYADSPVSGNWEGFVAEDLPAFIDANFRTIPEAGGRCLTGHSMGGAGALAVAMQRPGVYGSVYAMSPAILPQGQLEVFGPGFELLELLAERYLGQPREQAAAQFLADLEELDGKYYWALAYATAFGWDTSANPPYVALPDQDGAGGYVHDATWQRYEDGVGGLAGKVAECADSLKQLSALAFDYGTADTFAFIPPGCEELAALLGAHGVPYVMEAYPGGHNDRVEERLRDVVLPFAAEQLGAAQA